MFEGLKKRWRSFFSPKVGVRRKLRPARMYQAARPSRLQEGFGTSTTSADAELQSSLTNLRNRSRQLVRDAAYAKRAKVIIQNNVIGSGIGMQAQVMTAREKKLNDRVNDDIEKTWKKWSRADSCHTGGMLHFCDLERAAMGQIFETGEAFIRKHYRKFGNSEIPFGLELIEPERIPHEFQPLSPFLTNTRLGVETDQFYRPIAYWVRTIHPGEIRLAAQAIDNIERVPAEVIIHLKIIDRWPMTRGEPWLHAVVRKLFDMDGYTEAEIAAARGAASYMGLIETTEDYGETQEDGSKEVALEPGTVERLGPGEKFNFVSPNRPNSQIDPFFRLMLREIAAGIGTSYESLSRDYSQSNYSSSRLALLDDRDLWRVLQGWFIRSFREEIHREWIRMAVLSGALKTVGIEEYAGNSEKFEAVHFKPRGWSWIDPTKEVQAFKEAIKAGFTTVSQVINLTGSGMDLEDVLNERRRELDLMKEKGLEFDTEFKEEKKEPEPVTVEKEKPEEPEDDMPEEDAADEVERLLWIAAGGNGDGTHV